MQEDAIKSYFLIFIKENAVILVKTNPSSMYGVKALNYVQTFVATNLKIHFISNRIVALR